MCGSTDVPNSSKKSGILIEISNPSPSCTEIKFSLRILWFCQWKWAKVYFHFWGAVQKGWGLFITCCGCCGSYRQALLCPPDSAVEEPQPPSVGVWQDELSILGTQIKAKQERILLQTQKSLAKERLNNWTISAIMSAYFSVRPCRASAVLQCG